MKRVIVWTHLRIIYNHDIAAVTESTLPMTVLMLQTSSALWDSLVGLAEHISF